MNVIDQAFVKAYSRRSKPQSAEPTSGPGMASGAITASPDVSVHPSAAESAVVWIDATADQYLRRDTPHPTRSTPPPASDEARHGPITQRVRGAGSQAVSDQMQTGHEAHGHDAPKHVGRAADDLAQGIIRLQAQAAAHQSIDLSFLYHSVIASGTQPEALQPAVSPTIKRDAVAEPPLAPQPVQPSPAFKPFTALWEVDCFEFSDTVTALFGSQELMQSIGSPLDRAVSEGLQTVLITSDRAGVGQTSVATGIALSAATAGLRVALVDASVTPAQGPACSLADALNLDIQHGWPQAIRGGMSIAETAIHSIEDQLTVIPQIAMRRGDGPTADEFGRMIQVLRRGFDLIVIDGPSCREPSFAAFTTGCTSMSDRATSGEDPAQSTPIDAVILVQDVRNSDAAAAVQIMDSLKRQGITGLGLVENFT